MVGEKGHRTYYVLFELCLSIIGRCCILGRQCFISLGCVMICSMYHHNYVSVLTNELVSTGLTVVKMIQKCTKALELQLQSYTRTFWGKTPFQVELQWYGHCISTRPLRQLLPDHLFKTISINVEVEICCLLVCTFFCV